MSILPNDVLQEVFQLLCCPRVVPPDYSGLQKPIGYGQGQGEDGIEVVNLFNATIAHTLPTVHHLARVCKAWRIATAEIPRIWDYKVILDCTGLAQLNTYKELHSSSDGRISKERLLSHPQLSRCLRRLETLLSTRQTHPEAGRRMEPLLLTVTLHATSITPLNEHVLSILCKHSPQLSKLNLIGGWVAIGPLPPSSSCSSPVFGSLEELLIRDPSGTHPFPKMFRLYDYQKPNVVFPRLYTLTLCNINLPPLIPYLPWSQLTSLSLGPVGLRHTAGCDSNPDDIINVLRVTQALRYLRIYGRMRSARESNSCPNGQASDARLLVTLPYLTHLEVHDMDLTILASPLFTEKYTKSPPSSKASGSKRSIDPEQVLPGLLCTPSLRTLDVYVADSLSPRARQEHENSIPPVGTILKKFLKDRAQQMPEPTDEDNPAGRRAMNAPRPITLRIAIASPALFTLPYNLPESSIPLFDSVQLHVVHGASPTIFRLLRKRIPKAIGRDDVGALDAVKQLLTDGRLPKSLIGYQPIFQFCVKPVSRDTDERRVQAYLSQIAELELSGEGKVYRSDAVTLEPLTKDVVSTERFIERFVKVTSSESALSNMSKDQPSSLTTLEELGEVPQDHQYSEGCAREMIDVLAWDGTVNGDVDVVRLERWLYVLSIGNTL